MENNNELKYWKIIAVLVAIAGPAVGWVIASNSSIIRIESIANANAKELDQRRPLVDSIPALKKDFEYVKEQADKNSDKLDALLYRFNIPQPK